MKEIPLGNGQNAKAFAIDYILLIISPQSEKSCNRKGFCTWFRQEYAVEYSWTDYGYLCSNKAFGRFTASPFHRKAEIEMAREALTPELVYEAILNAPAIFKVLRSRNPKSGTSERLYVIKGLAFWRTRRLYKRQDIEERRNWYFLCPHLIEKKHRHLRRFLVRIAERLGWLASWKPASSRTGW